MTRLLKFTIIFSAILVISCSGAQAISFSSLNSGTNITINDTIWNSRYVIPYVQALGQGGEDNETERDLDNNPTITGQDWDLEGVFWNSTTGTLTFIGGFDFAHHAGGGNNVFGGDLFLGSFGGGYPGYPVEGGLVFTASTAFVFSRDLDGSLNDTTGTYNRYNDVGAGALIPTTSVAPSADPYKYKPGIGQVSDGYGIYTIGIVTETPFAGWNGQDTHYYLQLSGGIGSDPVLNQDDYTQIIRLTMKCGNDVVSGKVPEPSILLLVGFGIVGAGLLRRGPKA